MGWGGGGRGGGGGSTGVTHHSVRHVPCGRYQSEMGPTPSETGDAHHSPPPTKRQHKQQQQRQQRRSDMEVEVLKQQSTEKRLEELGMDASMTSFLVEQATAYEAAVAPAGLTAPPRLPTEQMMQRLRDTRHLLVPGAGVSDGGKGITAAFKEWFPKMVRLGDYAHNTWKHSQGRFLDKRHRRFEEVTEVLHEMHHCHTVGMYNVMCDCLVYMWRHDAALGAMYKQLFMAPNNRWHLGCCTTLGGITPCQNEQEVCCDAQNSLRKDHTPLNYSNSD